MKYTLVSIFESNKEALAKKLSGLTLPKDAVQVQDTVSNYLNVMFDSNSEYRQNLTLAEDHILQAALSLLNAQQDMSRKLSENIHVIEEKKSQPPMEDIPLSSAENKAFNMNVDGTKALLGAGGGAIVGKVVLGSWGAIFGAIAGTALVLYLANQNTKKTTTQPDMSKRALTIKENPQTPIDIDAFLTIIGHICESVDRLINTFRTQIRYVVDKYESQEKPTLEKEYSTLLESIQSLLGVAYSQHPDEKRLKKIDQRIEQLAESLENYELDIVSYTNEQKHLFEEVSSPNVTAPTMIYPAIVKKGSIVKKGKVFIKA